MTGARQKADQPAPTRAQQREHRRVMREELRLETHFGCPRHDVAGGILDQHHDVRRAGTRRCDVRKQRVVVRMEIGGSHRGAGRRSRQPAFIAHPQTAAVVDGRSAVETREHLERRSICGLA